ncbi:hypothetical protein HMPREF3036_00905, partial [Sutterella sp. KLE1602]|uniref:hypothetical protein n=1 Tax=Sutterella sp. KLE1602 TaxID=1574262 RepID=UPI000794610D
TIPRTPVSKETGVFAFLRLLVFCPATSVTVAQERLAGAVCRVLMDIFGAGATFWVLVRDRHLRLFRAQLRATAGFRAYQG